MNSSQAGSKLVDSIPQHSNSDIEGSVPSEEIFQVSNGTSATTTIGSINVWNIVTQSPFMLAVAGGLVVCIVLICVISCVIFSICRYFSSI